MGQLTGYSRGVPGDQDLQRLFAAGPGIAAISSVPPVALNLPELPDEVEGKGEGPPRRPGSAMFRRNVAA